MPRLWLALLAALALLLPSAARAEERILHFLSDVKVERDGTLAVTETIRVRAEGDTIRHGLQRDFPTRYEGKAGRAVRVGFAVEDVRRNGRPEPWTSLPFANGVRVRIGDPGTLLPPGEHEYHIHYRTTRQIGFFADYDELYWNATGTGWTFPIDRAEARIRLPEAAPFGARAVYTGPQGATERHADIASERPGDILFRATAPLDSYEGLTVAVAWPKGVVRPPASASRLAWWWQDNGPFAAGIAGLLAILAYYFHAWRRAGRGPSAGPVVPIFTPPDGLSPASVRYVSEMRCDNRTFAAAIVDLGVRGRIRLVEGEKGWFTPAKTTLMKTGDLQGLPAPEAAMMDQLFSGGDSLLMDDEYHATFSRSKAVLQKGLARLHEGPHFVRNLSWSLKGLWLVFASLWLTAAAVLAAEGVAASFGALALFVAAAFLYRWASPADTVPRIVGKIAAALLGLVAGSIGASTIGAALESGRILPLLVPLFALPVAISAIWWMAAPTKQGRALLDRIAGFRHYLSITEEERLQTLHPPEKTPELFERYLPYAIALDVENEWAERFAAVLAAAAAAGHAQTMNWYSGHSDPWNDAGGFVDRVGVSLSRSIASASTAPGSRSGSGGGGSSGGGGGGGGGSGW